jgi:hypothetical protein
MAELDSSPIGNLFVLWAVYHSPSSLGSLPRRDWSGQADGVVVVALDEHKKRYAQHLGATIFTARATRCRSVCKFRLFYSTSRVEIQQ